MHPTANPPNPADPKKKGILFFNLGGPDNLSAVQPFLYNLFSDPDIIKLPFSSVLQKPLAWYISSSRTPSVKGYYKKMGGRSPILRLTEAQGQALEASLRDAGHEFKVYIAMRYWHPFTEEALDQILEDGIEELILLPLYPHYSLTTTGSSMNEFTRILEQRNITGLRYKLIGPYYQYPLFQAALAETIREGLDAHHWSCPKEQVQILFSAHSLPKKFVKKTKDVYPEQIQDTCQRVMDDYFPGQPWELAYQSKVGKMPWLGPDTEGVIHYFAANRIDNILMVPVSFVSDHLETLYEIDMLYIGLANELKIPHCYRAEALNSRPTFIKALTGLVLDALSAPEPLPELPSEILQ